MRRTKNFLTDMISDLQVSIADGEIAWWWVAALPVAILVAIAIACLVWFRKRLSNGRQDLFKEICKAHQLTGRQRNLLRRFAGVRQLDDPLILMIDATRWHLDQLDKQTQLKRKEIQELHKLQSTLYAAPRLDNRSTLSDSTRSSASSI